MCIAAAIVGAAVVGAAGSAIAGSEAASATTSASNAAIAEQNKALGQQATLSAPYTQLGQSAIPQLQALLGLTPQGQPAGASANANTLAALQQTPGYQFARQQGLQGVQNAAASQGMLLSGNTLEGLQQFGTGLADQTYQQAVGNLENVVNTGQAAAAGQAANIGNAANNISNNVISQGNTLAGIDANTVAGLTKSLGSGVNNYIEYQTLQGLTNPGGSGAYNFSLSPGAIDTPPTLATMPEFDTSTIGMPNVNFGG